MDIKSAVKRAHILIVLYYNDKPSQVKKVNLISNHFAFFGKK